MMKNSKKLVFFGNERLATAVKTDTPVIRGLIDSGFEIAAIVSNFERGRSRNSRDLEISKVAEEHNIPLLLPEDPKDIVAELRQFDCDIAVLVAYGKIVPQEIIDIFPRGIVNIHPSLLPKHRGPTPIESVILESPDQTGVSIMALAKEMDAGPVYLQEPLALSGNETKQELADSLLTLGSKMLSNNLEKIINGEIEPEPQNDSDATYDNLIDKADGNLDWQKDAKELEREIRAYLGWPSSFSEIAGKPVTITEVKILKQSGTAGEVTKLSKSQFAIYCGNGALEILKLKPAGKAEMTAAGFISGYSL